MPLTAKQLELPYFIPTSENVHQILATLNGTPAQDKDFYLFRSRIACLPWRWEGTGRHVGQRSPHNFATPAEAIENAQSQLSNA
jgi:hypothetical protein